MSKIGEVVLFDALTALLEESAGNPPDQMPLYSINTKVRQALVEYADAGPVSHPKQWNPFNYEANTHPLQWFVPGFKELDPRVRMTSYEEVFKLIGTPGCSRNKEMWNWSCLGVLETPRGNLVVYPNDWIVEVIKGYYILLDDAEYRARYL